MAEDRQIDLTINPGMCNAWEVYAIVVKCTMDDSGCMEVTFDTQWENGQIDSSSTYMAQVPLAKQSGEVCLDLVFEGMYPQVASVGLVFCEELADKEDKAVVYWAIEYPDGVPQNGDG